MLVQADQASITWQSSMSTMSTQHSY